MLDGLRKERDRLATELAEIERAIAALEGSAAAQDGRVPKAGPYTAMTLFEAAAAYLAEAGEPRTTRQIADALLQGGFITRSTYFAGIVSTMLNRKESAQEFGIRRTRDRKRWLVGR